MFISSNRTLRRALTLSLLIHAVLLIGVFSFAPEQRDAPTATIRVDMVKGSQDEPKRTVAKSAAVPEPAVVPPRPSPSVSSAGPVQPVPSPSASAVIHAENSEAIKVASAENRPAVESSVPAPAGRAATESASVPREGVSADDMRLYRMALASATRRFKRYPALARDRSWEGTADIALSVGSRSMVPDVVLTKSSGQGILDEQALEMVTQAARVTRLPEGLKGRSFRVVLPVQFSLEGD